MKILKFNLFFPSGQRSSELYRTEYLEKHGHETVIISGGGENLLDTDLRVYRLPIRKYQNQFLDAYLNWTVYLVLGSFLGLYLAFKEDFDVVQANFVDLPGTAATVVSQLTGLPLVVYPLGRAIPSDTEPYSISGVKKILIDYVISSADQVLVESKHLQDKLYIESKLIPTGTDLELYRPLEKEPIILLVGDLIPRKNVIAAIEAFGRSDTDARMVVVGDGPLKNRVEEHDVELVSDLSEEELADLYGRSKVFFLPSLVETYGNVYVEALSSGCNVISSKDTGGEYIIGNAGYTVDPEDTGDMARCLERAMSEDRSGEAVKRSKRFRIENTAEDYIEALEKLI
ncbi:MAG: glycosyltransferase [Candidatus Nanohaloarchaea archaeon]